MKKLIFILSLWMCTLSIFAVVAHNPKRGVAFKLGDPSVSGGSTAKDLEKVASGSVSWWYTWGTSPASSVETIYQTNNMDFVPMIWGPDGTKTNFDDTALRNYLKTHPNVKYLLGFNEPNFSNQANTTPQQAATAWPKLEKVALDYGLKLVSPAVNYSGLTNWVKDLTTLPTLPYGMSWVVEDKHDPQDDRFGQVNINNPFNWLTAFFAYYPTAKVDYIACHTYMNTSAVVIDYVQKFITRFNKPVWLTEFCGWDGGMTAAGQEIYMRQTTASFDANPMVFRYAWFFGRNLYTTTPYSSLFTANQGELSKLGKIYCNLEDVVDPNAPEVINNAITIKIIDKTKGEVTNTAAWPDQSVYAWVGLPNLNYANIPNGAGDTFGAAGFYNGLSGGQLVKTDTEWTWSYSFVGTKSQKYAWNPGLFANATKSENPLKTMSTFVPKLNGGSDLVFNIDANGKATGQLTVIIENATTITVSNTETQTWGTVTIPKGATSLVGANNSSLGISIYPNPTDDVLNIATDFELKSVAFYNISGSSVLQSYDAKAIEVSSLEKGVYAVVVETIDGQRAVQKMVKK